MSSTEDWLLEILEAVRIGGWLGAEPDSREPNYLDTDVAESKIRQHMLSEAIELIGDDEKEFTKRSRPNDNSDTDKLWDLANGVEPISSSQFSTWGSSANAQFRKFALKLRNTIWREAELHNNELKAELRQAFTEKYGERE